MKKNISLGQLAQVVLLFFIISLGYLYISNKIDGLVQDRYLRISKEMKTQLKTLIDEKQNAILELSLAVAEDSLIKKALRENNTSLLKLDKFSTRLRENTKLKNVWFQVIKPDGVSFYRSFSHKRGDSLLKARIDIAKILKHPQIINSIGVGKFAFSMKAMVPVYDKGIFIGIIETIAQFNSIARKMEDLHYKTTLLVDKSYKKQLIFADKSRFIDDYFIANDNSASEYLEFIKSKTPQHVIAYNTNYHICKKINSIVTIYTLKDENNGKAMTHFVMALNINDVDIEDIMLIRENLLLVLGGLLFALFSIFIYFYLQSKQKIIKEMNTSLESRVEEKTKELAHLAHHDALTGLVNRYLFLQIAKKSIESAKREKSVFSILFLDLDRFKDVNDTYGHNAGDELLVTIASRIKICLRREDLVSRIGGDEFVVLVKNISEYNLVHIVEKIIREVQKPIEFEDNLLYITFSIGISSFPKDATDVERLISYADMAMYKAKELGRDRYQFYDKNMSKMMKERIEIEKNIKIALKEKQFEAVYQAQVDAFSGKILGAEALIRWNSPELGRISPDRFIPVAEETNLILEIDNWMMRETMIDLLAFEKEGVSIGRLSLNISARQLESKNIVKELQAVLKETAFEPHNLELEITERQMMKNPEASIVVLNKIKNLGISISVDDFGTGHSSLSYIKRLPIDKIKIDKSFVDGLPHDKDDKALVRSIISIAKNLEIQLIAEGVETRQQRDFLRDEGCGMIQGYFYSKPLSAREYKQLLLKNS